MQVYDEILRLLQLEAVVYPLYRATEDLGLDPVPMEVIEEDYIMERSNARTGKEYTEFEFRTIQSLTISLDRLATLGAHA